MAEKLLMLALSPTMDAGMIVKWLKKEGDPVATGDIICEVETDKATMDYESMAEGTLLKIVAAEGSRVKVGELIGVVGESGEDISTIIEKENAVSQKTVQNKEREFDHFQKNDSQKEGESLPGGVRASPLARELAKRSGINLATVKGSGPGGRIVKGDIEGVATQKHKVETGVKRPYQGVEKIPVSEKRRIIAKRLSQSVVTAPHYYVTVSVIMDLILQSRIRLNGNRSDKVSLNAFIIRLVAEAIKKNPTINSSWDNEVILRFSSIDIGVAVAQKDGLITPVVRNCQNKGIIEIDRELRDLVKRGREGKLVPEEYTKGTFTISNLGSYGIRQFTAIINPPESAILALGEIFREQVVQENGNVSIQNTMLMTISCDHRVIDGAVAAEFARDLKNIIENPVSVLF
jgi:pyruvate dehydrogenase E2 component (dihydrolipoamide acetyltransferase)